MATLSRRARDVVEQSFERTSDLGKASPLIQTRLQVGIGVWRSPGVLGVQGRMGAEVCRNG